MKLTNHIDGTEAPSIAEKMALMVLAAKTYNIQFMINDIRYSYAGYPSIICDDYVYFEAGSCEIGETGALGSEANSDVEPNPYPIIVLMSAVRGAEFLRIDASILKKAQQMVKNTIK